MRYSYEFKLEAVRLYKEGKFPPAPEGVKMITIRNITRLWNEIYDFHGEAGLKSTGSYRKWTPEEKLALINRYKNGEAARRIIVEENISEPMFYKWIRKYDEMGYNGLVDKKKGRKSKSMSASKTKNIKPREISESELEELIRLREENKAIKAENAVIKKEIALREEREAALLKAKRQQSSRNSEKKGMN